MKKISIIYIVLFSLLLLTTCKKDELKVCKLEFLSETIEKSAVLAEITVYYTYPVKIQTVKCLLSQSADMSNSKVIHAEINTRFFVVKLQELQGNTQYFYQYEYFNGVDNMKTEIASFTTNDYGLPTVTTNDVFDITATTVSCGGNVADDGELEVTAKGLCWSTNPNPTPADTHTINGDGTGEFATELTGLSVNTTYYIRAYATNAKGIGYGIQKEFKTLDGLAEVTTNDISNITASTAKCGGNVIDDGGFEVLARGVCWSTNQNPTINDLCTVDGTGLGAFISALPGLSVNTTYYVRAYATNANGTNYGEQKTFETKDGLPSVSTNIASNITSTSATCGGNVTSNGGFEVTAKGVCWSTNENPTIEDSHTVDGSGIGYFTSNITDLSNFTVYYVRAYATNCNGTVYGSQKMLKTMWESNIVGALDGFFSVSETQLVCFSQGNLQYRASTDTWRFAENQWDCIGENNSHISPSYSGWIDLFGWFTGSEPTNSSLDYYSYNTAEDWGINAISNGGNTANMWRTLSNDEWYYVFYTRDTDSGMRFAPAQVNGINGLILLPDNWKSGAYTLNSVNTNESYNSNVISLTNWKTRIEIYGAVFLPVTGYRCGTSLESVGEAGLYWSNLHGPNYGAYCVSFYEDGLQFPTFPVVYGCSVRLVCPAEN